MRRMLGFASLTANLCFFIIRSGTNTMTVSENKNALEVFGKPITRKNETT
jgi:hypothetical protein